IAEGREPQLLVLDSSERPGELERFPRELRGHPRRRDRGEPSRRGELAHGPGTRGRRACVLRNNGVARNLEGEAEGTDVKRITRIEKSLRDRRPVDIGAVRALQVVNPPAVVWIADHRSVQPRHLFVVEANGYVWRPADELSAPSERHAEARAIRIQD